MAWKDDKFISSGVNLKAMTPVAMKDYPEDMIKENLESHRKAIKNKRDKKKLGRKFKREMDENGNQKKA